MMQRRATIRDVAAVTEAVERGEAKIRALPTETLEAARVDLAMMERAPRSPLVQYLEWLIQDELGKRKGTTHAGIIVVE